jgi:hypothetical protein
MLKWKKDAKIITAILIILGSSVIAMSSLPTTTLTANAALATDMPVAFIDPQNVSASPGDIITVSLKIFNLSNNFYASDEAWVLGEPLGPPGGRYNYSLGNLYGIDIMFSWDPTLLEYVNHTVEIPVETYSNGILHQPIIEVQDDVDATNGTYRLARSSKSPADAFNAPNANATVFTMTFKVKKQGKCALNLDKVQLAVDRRIPGLYYEIPHWIKSGQFRTGELLTRIESVQVGALVGGQLYSPIISGENATVKISMINDGTTVDRYNLTIYDETSLLKKWENETLGADETKAFNYTIDAEHLTIGTHTLTVNATILHGGNTFIDELSNEFRVIGTPVLVIEGPSSASAGESITFSAAGSSHSDPNGQILNYTWTLWAPGESGPRQEVKNGDTVTFQLPEKITKIGNWSVKLEVKDNYGVEYDENRPATAPYQKTVFFEVGETGPPSIFTVENIALVLILVVIIGLAVVYLRRRSR